MNTHKKKKKQLSILSFKNQHEIILGIYLYQLSSLYTVYHQIIGLFFKSSEQHKKCRKFFYIIFIFCIEYKFYDKYIFFFFCLLTLTNGFRLLRYFFERKNINISAMYFINDIFSFV